MINDKIWDLRFANFVVHCMRQWCNRAKKDFRCVEKPGNTRVKIDNATGGAHIVEIKKQMRCIDFDKCRKCEKVCDNHYWNNGFIDLLKYLRDAKRDRIMAILNLFVLKRK